MARTSAAETIAIKKRELKAMLREVMREVLHEEVGKFLGDHAESWQYDPESPLFQALLEIREDAKAGRIKLLTHEEVFGK